MPSFLLLLSHASQDNYKKSRESNLLMPHNISSQGVDMEFLWVI